MQRSFTPLQLGDRTGGRSGHVRCCSIRYQKRCAAEAPRASRASNCLRARQKSASLRGRITPRQGGETMRRREFIALLGASVTWPFAATAQQAGRTYRLGCLLPLTRDAPVNVAFFDELRRRGFIEGQNLTVEYRPYALHFDLISQYAAELVKARVDVIIAGGERGNSRRYSRRRKRFRSSACRRYGRVRDS